MNTTIFRQQTGSYGQYFPCLKKITLHTEIFLDSCELEGFFFIKIGKYGHNRTPSI